MILFFGCWNGAGHDLRDANGRRCSYDHTARRWGGDFPWAGEQIDGALTPRARRNQGDAAIHRRDGWTAVAWHDYSIDSRGGSNCIVFVLGTLTFQQAIAEGRRAFPHVFERQPAPALVPDDKHAPAGEDS